MNDAPVPVTDPRIYMAAERTFLAWLRTGIAFMGFGFVVARFGLFLRDMAASNHSPTPTGHGFSLPVGVALMVLGVMINVIAAIRHHRYIKALDRGEFREVHGPAFAYFVAGLLALVGLAVAVYLAFFL